MKLILNRDDTQCVCLCETIVLIMTLEVCIYLTPSTWAECKTQSQFQSEAQLMDFLTGCLTKTKGAFIASLKAITRKLTQITSFFIWIWVAESISNDDNRYVKRTSMI